MTAQASLLDDLGPPRAKPTVVQPPTAPHALEDQRDADHRCRVCGRVAGFGFRNTSRSHPTRWACIDHQDEVERMPS